MPLLAAIFCGIAVLFGLAAIADLGLGPLPDSTADVLFFLLLGAAVVALFSSNPFRRRRYPRHPTGRREPPWAHGNQPRKLKPR